MIVYVFESEYRKFIDRSLPAFHANREYLEALVGRRYRNANGVEGFVVVANFFPVDHWAKEGSVRALSNEYEHVNREAREINQQFLGTIHTHPDGGSLHTSSNSPSPHDLVDALANEELVSGIVHQFVYKKTSGQYIMSSPNFVTSFEPCWTQFVNPSDLLKMKWTMREYHLRIMAAMDGILSAGGDPFRKLRFLGA